MACARSARSASGSPAPDRTVLDGNARIARRRWPALLEVLESARGLDDVRAIDRGAATLSIGGVQLTSARDRRAEARLQARLVRAGSREATVYGVALGDLPRELLARPELERLRVVVLNAAVVRAAWSRFDASDWLADERVELVHGQGERELGRPFAAAPAALRLAEDACARIRDLVAIELAAPYVHRHLAAREQELARRIEENRPLLDVDGDVGELFGREAGGPVVVAAAGPTLVDAIPDLAREGAPPIVAVDASLVPLARAGIVPRYVVTIEANREGLLPLFDFDARAFEGSTLVYSPVVPGDVLRAWPGPRVAAVSAHERFAALRRGRERAALFQSGSVIHPATDFAVRLGASDVVFCGADFGFPGGRTHVAGAVYDRAADPARGGGAWVLDGRGERLPSLPNLRAYLRDLEGHIAGCPGTAFWRTDARGAAIEGAPLRPEFLRG